MSVAIDYILGKIPSRDRQPLLRFAKHLDTRKTQNLPYELLIKESGNYIITHNVNITDGLTNGADCKVVFIQSENNKPLDL